MAVARGDADRGHHEWDAAAPVTVARHFGLYVSHLDRRPLRLNRPDTIQCDLLVCHPRLAAAFLAALSAIAAADDQ